MSARTTRRPHTVPLASLALAAVAALALAAPAEARSNSPAPAVYSDMLPAEARSQTLCEADPTRIFVRHGQGTACLATIVTRGQESQRIAVVFFDGDVPKEQFADSAARAQRLVNVGASLQALADKSRIRIVRIGRLGIDGSSGNHANRHKTEEVMAMNAAIDVLKTRLGLDQVVVAGQSRGAMIAASLLTLGRRDIACAALGSGVYEHARFIHIHTSAAGSRVSLADIQRIVYDPSKTVAGIVVDPLRRVFVIGDPEDQRTPFDQQQRFAGALETAGHHARVLEIRAGDDLRHGATAYTMAAAALCARDLPETSIEAAVIRMRKAVEQRLEAAKPKPPMVSLPLLPPAALPSPVTPLPPTPRTSASLATAGLELR